MRIAVVGSINLDLVARVARLPRAGETVSGATFERVPGGKGANQAVAAARLGGDVEFHGAVGRDTFADEVLAALGDARVDTTAVRTVEQPTGVALILVDAAGENQIVVAPGANAALRPEDVVIGPGVELTISQLETPVEVAISAFAESSFNCLNAAPAQPVPGELLASADLVVVNRYEYEALGAEPTLTALTLGAEGAVLLSDGEEIARASAPKVEAVDGTAAGDAFTACLAMALVEERTADDALRRACAAGALAASRFGAQPSLPTAAEVDAILAR